MSGALPSVDFNAINFKSEQNNRGRRQGDFKSEQYHQRVGKD